MRVARCSVLYFLLLSSSAEGNTKVNTCSNEECVVQEVKDDVMLLQTGVNIHVASDRADGSDPEEAKEKDVTDVSDLEEGDTEIETKVSQDEMLADFQALATKWKSFQKTEEPDEVSKVVSKSLEDITQSLLDRQSDGQELDEHEGDEHEGEVSLLLEQTLYGKDGFPRSYCACNFLRDYGNYDWNAKRQFGYTCGKHGSDFDWCYTCVDRYNPKTVAGRGKGKPISHGQNGCIYGTESNPAGKKWAKCDSDNRKNEHYVQVGNKMVLSNKRVDGAIDGACR